jgi:hypothetical protein
LKKRVRVHSTRQKPGGLMALASKDGSLSPHCNFGCICRTYDQAPSPGEFVIVAFSVALAEQQAATELWGRSLECGWPSGNWITEYVLWCAALLSLVQNPSSGAECVRMMLVIIAAESGSELMGKLTVAATYRQ